jgi:glucokinase
MILACDVGGTKVRLAFYSYENKSFHRHETETYSSREYSSLDEIVRLFLQNNKGSIEKVCFGVPGPVMNGSAQTTNLPWKISEAQLTKNLGITKVKLVNDLAATTAAIPHFSTADLIALHPGEPAKMEEEVYAMLAPGTGLGQGFLVINSNGQYVLESEGGHMDFAPCNNLEIELFIYLKNKFGHVSYERVLSGPGLVNIYNFLKDGKYADEPAELTERFKNQDPAVIISKAGQAAEFEICVKALDIFASILGAQAGNLVLTLLTTSGVYLGGGIPPKIYKKLMEGITVASYLNKGRLSYLVEKTPLYIVRDDYAALLGAASIAEKMS